MIHLVTCLDGTNHQIWWVRCSYYTILVFIVQIMQSTHARNKQKSRSKAMFHAIMQLGELAIKLPSLAQLPWSLGWLLASRQVVSVYFRLLFRPGSPPVPTVSASQTHPNHTLLGTLEGSVASSWHAWTHNNTRQRTP